MPKKNYIKGEIAKANLRKAASTDEKSKGDARLTMGCDTFIGSSDCGPTARPCEAEAPWNIAARVPGVMEKYGDEITKMIPMGFIEKHGPPPYGPPAKKR